MASILLKLLTKSLPPSFQANLLSHHLDSISYNFAILTLQSWLSSILDVVVTAFMMVQLSFCECQKN
jgi:hypothetical protein